MAAKKRERKRHAIPEEDIPFAYVSHRMMNSEAWKKLSPYAEACYLAIKKKYNGKNWNNLSLTYSEMKHKMSSATFSKVAQRQVETRLCIITQEIASIRARADDLEHVVRYIRGSVLSTDHGREAARPKGTPA